MSRARPVGAFACHLEYCISHAIKYTAGYAIVGEWGIVKIVEKGQRDTRDAPSPRAVRDIVERSPLVTLDGVAQALGLTKHRVKILRAQACAENRTADALPEPLPLPGVTPVWHLGEIIEWGRRTGRLDPDGTARRLTPPGRPRSNGI